MQQDLLSCITKIQRLICEIHQQVRRIFYQWIYLIHSVEYCKNFYSYILLRPRVTKPIYIGCDLFVRVFPNKVILFFVESLISSLHDTQNHYLQILLLNEFDIKKKYILKFMNFTLLVYNFYIIRFFMKIFLAIQHFSHNMLYTYFFGSTLNTEFDQISAFPYIPRNICSHRILSPL